MGWTVTLLTVFLVGGFVVLAVPASAQVTILYDVTFGTPPHTVGSLPATGAGPVPRNTITSIERGTPTVVSALGTMTTQPLRFDAFDGQGDQIKLDLFNVPSGTSYCFQTLVLIADMGRDAMGRAALFSILFDTPPDGRIIQFGLDGGIRVFVPSVTDLRIGNFAFQTILAVQVEVDLAGNSWKVSVPGGSHVGSFGGATAIASIRFSTDTIANPPGGLEAIDNVLVSVGGCPGVVIPTFVDVVVPILAATALLVVLDLRWRRRKSL